MKKSASESNFKLSNYSDLLNEKTSENGESNVKRRCLSYIIQHSFRSNNQEIPNEDPINVNSINPIIRVPEGNPFQIVNADNSIQIPEEIKVEINNNVNGHHVHRNPNISEINPNFREMWISLKLFNAISKRLYLFNQTYLNRKEVIVSLNIIMAIAVIVGFIICIFSISRDCNRSISSIYIVFFSIEAALNIIISVFYIINIILTIRDQRPNKFFAISFVLSYLLLIINTIACIIISPNFTFPNLKLVLTLLIIFYTFPFLYHVFLNSSTVILFLIFFVIEFLIRLITCNIYKPCQPTEEQILSGEAVMPIPLTKLRFKNKLPLETECAICLSGIDGHSDICKLECYPTHIFHHVCLEEWTKHKSLCPICRSLIKCCEKL